MNADAVQRLREAGNVDDAVQETAALETQVGDVLIVGVRDRVARQDGVAVVAVVVDGVASVGGGWPEAVSEKCVLRFGGPVFDDRSMPVVAPLDFLQEDEIG